MKKANRHLLDVLLRPLWGLAEDEVEVSRYKDVCPDDETAYRSIIRERLKPAFDNFSEEDQLDCKVSLRYFLSKPGVRFDRIVDSSLVPFGPPRDPRQFFVWFWQECFGNEMYLVDDIAEYREIEDLQRPILIKTRMQGDGKK